MIGGPFAVRDVGEDGDEKLVRQTINGQRAIPDHVEVRALLSNCLLDSV